MEKAKFTLETENKIFELELGQSPRGLREKEHRPHLITVEVKKTMDRPELSKLIRYLIELEKSMLL